MKKLIADLLPLKLSIWFDEIAINCACNYI